jgi:hypothetical protein
MQKWEYGELFRSGSNWNFDTESSGTPASKRDRQAALAGMGNLGWEAYYVATGAGPDDARYYLKRVVSE